MVTRRACRRGALWLVLAAWAASPSGPQAAEAAEGTKIKVGFCARTISSAASPFAIAMKLGWFAEERIVVDLVPMPGSTDCVRNVATKEVDFALPRVEPLAIARPQGLRAKIYYTAYQGNIYGIAVPAESPIQKVADLKGKSIGVIAMGSAGVIMARALAATAGMDPDKDIKIVVAGEGARPAALLQGKQVDAL